MRPITSILNPKFQYRSSGSTDVRKTWAKYRREQAAAKPISNVATLKKAVK